MNQMPDKIWINPLIDLPKLSGVINKDSVQYVHKDAFEKLLALERKACTTKTIEWFFIQLNEGDMQCGDIEKFVDNYKKYMEE